LSQDGDLMAEGNDLSLLSGTGPKRRSDQSQKGDEKWTHRGNDDDLTNGAKTCIFNLDGVFGIHRSRFAKSVVYTIITNAGPPNTIHHAPSPDRVPEITRRRL
jgi:hypothetical protein